jgi:GNAT superfamily N-acetyltransferase
MNFITLPAEDADMARLFEITSLAFGKNEPFWDAMYPRHETPEGRRIGGERFIQAKHADPNTLYLKAVDENTGDIAGFAKWNVFRNRFPAPAKAEGDFWDNDEEKAYTQHLMTEFNRDRMAHLKLTSGNAVNLDICVIDPKYQRMGIGGLLVQWGINKADELGFDAIVESSVFGKGLYEKNGFEFRKNVTLPLPDKWADRPKSSYAWLVRPKKAKK